MDLKPSPPPPPNNTNKQQQMSLQDLPIESLSQLQKNLENDIRNLEGSMTSLVQAMDRYSVSLTSAKMVGVTVPQKLLIPLTPSMYANGVTVGDGKLMVDLGTGFFARMDGKDAEGVIERRIEYVRKNLEAFKKQHLLKRQQLEAVTEELQYKISQRVGQQQQQLQKR
jgi:prefoldin alpha subunit